MLRIISLQVFWDNQHVLVIEIISFNEDCQGSNPMGNSEGFD